MDLILLVGKTIKLIPYTDQTREHPPTKPITSYTHKPGGSPCNALSSASNCILSSLVDGVYRAMRQQFNQPPTHNGNGGGSEAIHPWMPFDSQTSDAIAVSVSRPSTHQSQSLGTSQQRCTKGSFSCSTTTTNGNGHNGNDKQIIKTCIHHRNKRQILASPAAISICKLSRHQQRRQHRLRHHHHRLRQAEGGGKEWGILSC